MDVCMPAPIFYKRQSRPKPYAEFAMLGLAAIGIGILAGIWIAGPALTGDGTKLASDPVTRWLPMSYSQMIQRPDPSPYRSATPDFSASWQIDYAASAKARAQAETSGQGAGDDRDGRISERQSRRPAWRNDVDRHAVQ
jgi:hypothetical protein